MRNIAPITDPYEVEQLRRLDDGIIDRPAHLNAHWLARNGWMVVPVESGVHFSDDQAAQISIAFKNEGRSEVFAIATEQIQNFPLCFVVKTTKEGLLEFSWECAHFNFALVPGDRTLVVLCTVYDYFLVAGPASFVEVAIGQSIDAARVEFDEIAADPCWEGRLKKVADRYRRIKPLES